MATFAEHGIEVRSGVGGEQRAVCPRCAPNRKPEHRREKDLAVNVTDGTYYCHHCGWAGSVNDRSEETWRDRPPIRPVYTPPKPPAEGDGILPAGVLAWFAKRGIPEWVLAEANITAGEEFCPQLGKPTLAVRFPYLRSGELVNVKYRAQPKHFWMAKGAERILYGLDGIAGAEEIVIVEGECLPGETEVLTPSGWVRLDQFRGGLVAEYRVGSRLAMVNVNAVVRKHFSGNLVVVSNDRGFSVVATPDHRMVALDRRGRIEIHAAKEQPVSTRFLPRSGVLDGSGIALSDDQLRFAIAVSADASIRGDGDDNYRYSCGRYANASFKKERKIDRFRALALACGVTVRESVSKAGYAQFLFTVPDWCPGRLLPMSWGTEASARQREVILSELVLWDGNSVPDRTMVEYSTKHAHNADVVQAIAHGANRVATLVERKNDLGCWIKVIISERTRASWQALRLSELPHDGFVWCVQVPSGMVLVRYKGSVAVVGNCDKLTIDAVQGPPAVSVPDGAPPPDARNYEAKLAFLAGDAEDRLRSAKRVLIATDMDAPGEKLADVLARRIGYGKCARVSWPDGCKDANETLTARGATAVCDALMAARPYPVEGIVAVRDLAPAVERLYERGLDKGDKTHEWVRFDRHVRARQGLLAIVTGSPGSGKSIFLDNWLLHLARAHDWTFAVCSPENQPLERHAAGMLAAWQGKPFADGPMARMSLGEVREGMVWLDRHVAFVLPEEPTVDAILERAETLVYRMGIRGLLINPWNELDHSRPERLSETEYISQSLSKIRTWARRRGVMVWLVAHPIKLQKGADGRYPPATPYDISGSSHWYNKADICLSVYRETNDQGIPGDQPEVRIQKVRFAETGEVGVVEFTYDRPTYRFTEIGK